MTVLAPISETEAERLRQIHYNAQVVDITEVHDDLRIFRVRPDRGIPPFQAGQYTVLGLGYWEPRIYGVQSEQLDESQLGKVVKRAYSVCSPLLDEDGRLVRADAMPYLEFLIALVRHADSRAPALTPRLFALDVGDRLHCGPHMHGRYTLDGIARDANVVFAATGTGEAPNNAMIAQLLASGHRGKIASVVCVRYRQDLAYLPAHRALQNRYANYRFFALTTREPENIDTGSPGYVGKKYLQDYFGSGDFEHVWGVDLVPEMTHVFLCGSPDMIGVPHHTHDQAKRYPTPEGMVEVLENQGFQVDQPHEPGNIHFEKYW